MVSLMTNEFDIDSIQDPKNEGVGGWGNKCAALLHMDAMGHPELLSSYMERLREHPTLQEAWKKLSKKYAIEGTKVYKKYI